MRFSLRQLSIGVFFLPVFHELVLLLDTQYCVEESTTNAQPSLLYDLQWNIAVRGAFMQERKRRGKHALRDSAIDPPVVPHHVARALRKLMVVRCCWDDSIHQIGHLMQFHRVCDFKDNQY